MPNSMPPPRRRPTSSAENAPAPRRPPSGGAAARRPASGPRPEAGGGAAKLVCTAGPRAGNEYPLDGAEVVVGRATDVEVSIPDTSVSRRHAQLRKVGQSWVVTDLGSGNGTLVNGEAIAEEHALHNGDVIACGDTELSFVNAGNSTDRRPVPRRTASDPNSPVRRMPTVARPRVARAGAVDPVKKNRGRRLLLFAVLFVLVAAGGLGALKYKELLRKKAEIADTVKRDEARRHLGEIFQEGKNLVRQGKWDEAKGKFEEIRQMQPDYPGVPDYLARAEKEIPNQQALAAAGQALKGNQIGAAAAALAKVSPDTQQFQALRDLKSDLDARVIKRIDEATQLGQGASRIASKPDAIAEYQKVVAITEDILAAIPDHRDATVLKENADAKIKELSYVAPPPPPPTPRPWEDATRQFLDGDLTGAFAIANNCAAKGIKRCKEKLDLMRQFNELYKKLEDLDAKGLVQLLAINDRITEGRPSKLSKNAGTRAANIFFKSAAAAKAAGQWGRALDYAQRALKADPAHAGATQIVGELRNKAKDVYLLGYSIKDSQPEEAIQKFKEVMQLAPPSDEWHQKAKRRLEELGK